MKRICIAMLVICLVLSLAACKKASPISDATTDITPSDNSEQGEGIFEQKPMFSVSLPVITDTEKAPDGTTLLTNTYQSITLNIPDTAVTDVITENFLAVIDEYSGEYAAELLEYAKNEYAQSQNFMSYMNSIIFEPMRLDSSILSLFGDHAFYTGGIHPNSAFMSITYDLCTGQVISLEDILAEAEDSDALYTLTMEALASIKESKYLFDNYEESVKLQFSDGRKYDNGWYLSDTGLCIYFPPYEIAPYASGAIIAEIPYKKLNGVLKDAYFPLETDSPSGQLFVQSMDTVENTDNFSQFSEIVLDPDGDRLLLHTDRHIRNIRISTALKQGGSLLPTHTVLAAESLTPGDAIFLQADFSESQATITVTYKSENDMQYKIVKTSDGFQLK